MLNKTLVEALVATGLMMGFGGLGYAAVDTQDLTVNGTVVASCEFTNAPTLAFGTTIGIADLRDGKNEETAAQVDIICTNTGVAAKLYGAATREMSKGADTITYEVYTNAERTTALGSTLGTGFAVTADGTTQSIDLYGKILSGQATKPAGAYSQNLQLTVEF